MSPRKYDMTRRASAAAQTRRRIIDATRALHTEQGIAATSWDEIAARAGVGVGTVYRHFPSLDELIPACGETTMQAVALPDPAPARALVDLNTWEALRDQGLGRDESVTAISDMLVARLSSRQA